jgi:hypothetical protein
MSKTSDSRSVELTGIRDWCIAIIHFMRDLSPSDLFDQTEEVINATYQRGDLRGLKTVSKDVNEWVGGLSRKDRQKLNQLLQSRFGKTLREDALSRNEVSGILRRGRISDEHEYQLLVSRSDEIYADDSKKDELERINSLLVEYQES